MGRPSKRERAVYTTVIIIASCYGALIRNVRLGGFNTNCSYWFHHPSSIIHHPSSIIHHPSSIIHGKQNLKVLKFGVGTDTYKNVCRMAFNLLIFTKIVLHALILVGEAIHYMMVENRRGSHNFWVIFYLQEKMMFHLNSKTKLYHVSRTREMKTLLHNYFKGRNIVAGKNKIGCSLLQHKTWSFRWYW